ncbi:CLUMA_CG012862, isoform A [Clunio marinus]|uniref:CLUMA_CG012862, isoform A n=1 Tax=Clunio marinus TaxID=568069 RepID=A0A1J1IH62_9DIPT|nr:CLUMA_CG012862, isoform A [Clunio marinus]
MMKNVSKEEQKKTEESKAKKNRKRNIFLAMETNTREMLRNLNLSRIRIVKSQKSATRVQ